MSKANRYIVQKTDFPTPKQIFYITPQEHFIYKLIAKSIWSLNLNYSKRNTDKKSFFPIFARLKKEKCH